MPLSIGTVYCIGRNFSEHALELKNEIPKSPVVFLKPASSVIQNGGLIRIPAGIGRVDHEVELVVRIGMTVPASVSEKDVHHHISHYAIGIDVTARDLQSEAKSKGLPWALSKGLATFAPLSAWVEASRVPDSGDLSLSLSVNGVSRQQGSTREMIFSVENLVSYLSRYFNLGVGDLIFCGTPAGVGPIVSKDQIVATLGKDLAILRTSVE